MKTVNGILLIYHHLMAPNATTIMEHVNAFEQHSHFKVWKINTEMGFPRFLYQLKFNVIVLHYSLFGWLPFSLHKSFFEYVRQSIDSYKIAFFQDEYRFWPERADLLYTLHIDSVYTLVENRNFDVTYGRHTTVRKLTYNLPAYVSTEAVNRHKKVFIPDNERTVDVGYRGRQPAFYLGRGAQEKHLIAVEFNKRAKHLGLRLEIETEESKRIYDEDWIRFLANCKSVLGVEAGTSIFDIDNSIRPQYAAMCKGNPDLSFPDCSFEEVYDAILAPHEDQIYYRTISARHFEAASLYLCQILFEGKYSEILKPMVHYIPLKKDFSNFDMIIDLFRNENIRRELTENAYRDLIASERYTYKRLLQGFDKELLTAGYDPEIRHDDTHRVTKLFVKDKLRRYLFMGFAKMRQKQFPGRNLLKPFLKPLFDSLLGK